MKIAELIEKLQACDPEGIVTIYNNSFGTYDDLTIVNVFQCKAFTIYGFKSEEENERVV